MFRPAVSECEESDHVTQAINGQDGVALSFVHALQASIPVETVETMGMAEDSSALDPLTGFQTNVPADNDSAQGLFNASMFLAPEAGCSAGTNSLNSFSDVETNRIPLSLVHEPTTLIEYWFAHICPIWSTFDSDINFNRSVASATWSSSQAVFHTLQSMSAARLAPTMPVIKAKLYGMCLQAKESIKLALGEMRAKSQPTVETHLVFAVLAAGTSLHWSDSHTDTYWLGEAESLVSMWRQNFSECDTITHAYFENALIYWRMLLSASVASFRHNGLERRRMAVRCRLQQAISPTVVCSRADSTAFLAPFQAFSGTRPSSWCGISGEVIDIFGQILALCRSTKDRERRQNNTTLNSARDSLCDATIAHDIYAELAAMDFTSTVCIDAILGFPVVTKDEQTPISHLIQTAEAYRLAAVLQLSMVFEDIPAGELCSVDPVATDVSARSQQITGLALRILDILESIPVESGARSLHPILYLSAASGLKYDVSTKTPNSSALRLGPVERSLNTTGGPETIRPLEENGYNNAPTQMMSQSPGLSIGMLKISKGRQLVNMRMSLLQQVLPPQPLEIMAGLIKQIWSAYDDRPHGVNNIHWLDIMVTSGFKTLLR